MNESYENQTSGQHCPFWKHGQKPIECNSISSNLQTSVVIVGAGISGLTTAYLLLKSGVNVVVIDDGEPGSGETGRTTAHLSNALDDRYYELASIFGRVKTRMAAESHSAAIDQIEQIVWNEGIECEFTRLKGYLFLHPNDKPENLKKEFDAARRAGVEVDWVLDTPGIAGVNESIGFNRQAQFHIVKYLRGLIDAITRMGGEIYGATRAEKISEGKVFANGYEITAEHVVVATNSPVNDLVTMHTKQAAYRTYVIGGLIPKNSLPLSLWWDTGDNDSRWVAKPYHYVRLSGYDDQYDLLIAGGEDHKTGQADEEGIPEEDRYDNLIDWTRKHFPMMGEIAFRWSGQVMEPVDCLGFLGRNPGDEKVYIITGDSGNGMTHGTIGAMIVSDMIRGVKNKWEELYDPSRITLDTAVDFLKENANVVASYGDWLGVGHSGKPEELDSGTGGIFSSGFTKAAVYKDERGKLHFHTAVCPHMGCIVRWNQDERSFDCPCHGSRFSCHGELLNGPALVGLTKIKAL